MDHVLNVHLETILGLHNCSVLEAIGQQLSWERENILQKNTSLLDIAAEICLDYPKVLSKLLSLMGEPKFTGWKYGLSLIKFIIWSDPEFKSALKSKNTLINYP